MNLQYQLMALEECFYFSCISCPASFETQLGLDEHRAHAHPICVLCPRPRQFQNANNLRQHMRSVTHTSKNVACVMHGQCSAGFVSMSAMVSHLESGGCPSGLTRGDIDIMVMDADVNGLTADPLRIVAPHTRSEYLSTLTSTWNGGSFVCYLCYQMFPALHSLKTHLSSLYHTGSYIYRCPAHECGAEFKIFSALMRHIEDTADRVHQYTYVIQAIQDVVDQFVDYGCAWAWHA
jgi:hypothetical protein